MKIISGDIIFSNDTAGDPPQQGCEGVEQTLRRQKLPK